MAYFQPPKPLKVDKPIPAGLPTVCDRDVYRYNTVLPIGPFRTKFEPTAGWNPKGHKFHSDIFDLPIGIPFDHSKPRKGHWGATPGTTLADMTEFFPQTWEEMKVPKARREANARQQAKEELHRRIELCLSGNYRKGHGEPC